MNDSKQHSPQNDFSPEIRRVRIRTLTIYEISETELDSIEKGLPDQIFLNIAIFLISSAITFTVTLLTTTICSDRVYILFVILAVLGYIGGVVLLLLWWKTHKSISMIVGVIRKRMPPEGILKKL